jgi:hypothetical protein
LEGLSGDIKGKIIGIDYSLDKVEISGDKFIELVRYQHSSNVKFDGGRFSVVILKLRVTGLFGDE